MRRAIGASRNQPTFRSGTEAALNQQIEVLATLATALLGELELLHSTVSTTPADPPGRPEPPLGNGRQNDFFESRIDFYQEVERYEISLIKRALRQSSGNQRKAADLLALNTTTLHAKIKHYGLHTAGLTAHYSSHLDMSRQLARGGAAIVAPDQTAAETDAEIAKSGNATAL